MILHLIVILVSLIILDQASHMTISNAVKVSDITKLGKTAVGFSILAFSTSLPELSVAFVAAFTGESSVSVGNVLGSNIVNISLIIGLAAVIIPLWRPRRASVTPSFAKEELSALNIGLLISSIIPLIMLYIMEASWLGGLILILTFVFYTYQLYQEFEFHQRTRQRSSKARRRSCGSTWD
jgi:cation:H+ antiporter